MTTALAILFLLTVVAVPLGTLVLMCMGMRE